MTVQSFSARGSDQGGALLLLPLQLLAAAVVLVAMRYRC